jgi:hypothetical protein
MNDFFFFKKKKEKNYRIDFDRSFGIVVIFSVPEFYVNLEL